MSWWRQVFCVHDGGKRFGGQRFDSFGESEPTVSLNHDSDSPHVPIIANSNGFTMRTQQQQSFRGWDASNSKKPLPWRKSRNNNCWDLHRKLWMRVNMLRYVCVLCAPFCISVHTICSPRSTLHQYLVYLVKPMLEIQLSSMKLDELKATTMITQTVANGDQGMVYYVKVHTSEPKWPWIFCKIYEPPLVTDVSPVTLKGFKKMTEDYKLVTF